MIKINVKHHIFIKLPAEEVFTYVSNLENLADWSSIVISARKSLPDAIQVGTTAHCTIRFLGKWLDITFEVIEYNPYHYLTIKSVSGASPSLFCYQFEPVEGGGTMVSQEAVIHHSEGIVNLIMPVITSAVRRQLEYDLQTLKDMLEAKAYRIAD